MFNDFKWREISVAYVENHLSGVATQGWGRSLSQSQTIQQETPKVLQANAWPAMGCHGMQYAM